MGKIITNLSLGGSGGINYLSTQADAESGVGSIVTYNDGASVAPVDGIGGVVSGLTVSTTTGSDKLRGAASYVTTKSAANTQGMGWSMDFDIDPNDQGRVVTLSFDYAITGAFTYGNLTSDLQMFVYDKTNGTIQQFAPASFVSNKDKWRGIFQCASNSTSYRLIFHVATTTTSAWSFVWDNLKCGPQSDAGINQGTIVTDWQSYTPTWTTGSTQPVIGNGTLGGRYRRVGDSIEAEITVVAGSSTTFGAGTWAFGIPAGLSADTSKLVTSGGGISSLGVASGFIGAVSTYAGSIYYNSTTSVGVQGPSQPNQWSSAAPATWNTSSYFSLRFLLPIQGWSSGGVIMQQDTDTRVIAANVYSASAQSLTNIATTKINLDTVTTDKTGMFDVANNRVKILIPGTYRIFGQVMYNASGAGTRETSIRKNGSAILAYIDQPGSSAAPTTANGSVIADLAAGDYLELLGYSSGGTTGVAQGAAFTYLTVERLSGPSAIAASESVNFRVAGTPTTLPSPANTGFLWNTKSYDTHGAYNASTGIWTCPIPGKYSVKAVWSGSAGSSLAAGNTFYMFVNKNGTQVSLGQVMQPVSGTQLPFPAVSDTLQLVAGDQIYIGMHNNTGVTMTGDGAGTNSWFAMERVGN